MKNRVNPFLLVLLILMTAVFARFIGGSDRLCYFFGAPGAQAYNYPYPYNPPSSAGYLSFSAIGDPQKLVSYFPVTVTARKPNGTKDTGFNKKVNLSASSGPVYPSPVQFTLGVWSGSVAIFEAGTNIFLKASGGDLSGTSNFFSIEGAGYGGLDGKVKDNWKNVLPGALVYLSRTPGGQSAFPPATTDGLGSYSFDSVPSGRYYVRATYGNISSDSDIPVDIPNARATIIAPLVLNIHPPASGPKATPLVLVPGIMGSTDKNMAGGIYPRLKDHGTLDTLLLHEQFGRPGWQELKDLCTGTVITVVDCPWDWRLSMKTCVEQFLKPAIENAKNLEMTKRNGERPDKVNVIAHSMGGLLVREYIQGDFFDNDIENFTMVGTPNEGSTNAYYIWEGGDPKKVDDLTDGIMDYWVNFDWETVKKLYKDTRHLDLKASDYNRIKRFIQDSVPTVRQLLPTYEFLKYNGFLKAISFSGNTNDFLLSLNADNKRLRMARPGISGKVGTRVYHSDFVPTIFLIDVTNPGFYEDGQPTNNPALTNIGDGTVPAFSATFPVEQGWAEGKTIDGGHTKLIGENANLIYHDLYPTLNTLSPVKRAEKIAAGTGILSNSLNITFNGRCQPNITDPLGRSVGINFDSGKVINNIPDTDIVIGTDAGSLSIINPIDGIYTVYLKGIYQEDYQMDIGYMDATNSKTADIWGFNNATIISFTVKVASTSTGKVSVINQPPPLSNLKTIASGGLTRLTWASSMKPGYFTYKIYAKKIDAPYFSLIGTTANTFFNTVHPWAANASSVWVYAISVVKGEQESFFSNMAFNTTDSNLIP